MALVYDESVYAGPVVPYHRINANKGFLTHYANELYLNFIAKNGNDRERRQAERELVICLRKQEYAKKHPNFSWDAVTSEMKKLKQQWL